MEVCEHVRVVGGLRCTRPGVGVEESCLAWVRCSVYSTPYLKNIIACVHLPCAAWSLCPAERLPRARALHAMLKYVKVKVPPLALRTAVCALCLALGLKSARDLCLGTRAAVGAR